MCYGSKEKKMRQGADRKMPARSRLVGDARLYVLQDGATT